MTVGAGSLRSIITRSDGHPALRPESGGPLSYAGLQRALDRAAGRLAALGVREGDRVAIAAANGPGLIVAFLAVVASGAVAAPLNPALGAAELAAELEDLRVSRLLHDGVASAVAAAGRSGVAASVFGLTEGLLRIDGEAGAAVEAAGSADALALLLHTSGTTSKPKTVPIRQRNLVASTAAVAGTYALTGDDVTACVMPLFHVHGLVATVLATLSTGGTVLLPRFRPSTFWDDTARHRRDLVHGGADHPCAVAHAGAGTAGGTESPPPFRTVLLGTIADGTVAAVRGDGRRPARRGVRDDRGGAPDGIQPAAAARAPAGHGRAGHRHRGRRA